MNGIKKWFEKKNKFVFPSVIKNLPSSLLFYGIKILHSPFSSVLQNMTVTDTENINQQVWKKDPKT